MTKAIPPILQIAQVFIENQYENTGMTGVVCTGQVK
jgi:hypothetical protein